MDGFTEKIGIERTKMGGGDKDPAYVIKENMFMKIALAVMGALLLLAIILAITVLDVKLARHSTVVEHAHTRHEQHLGHRDTIKHDMKMQEILQDEIQDLDMVADARVAMASLLHSYMKDVDKTLAKHHEVHKVTKADMQAHGDRFGHKAKFLMNKLFKEMQTERNKAQKLMQEVSSEIQKEEHDDEQEHEDYDKYMDEQGEHQGDSAGEEFHADDDEEAGDDSAESGHTDAAHEAEDPDAVKKQLVRFFEKFNMAKMLNLQEHTVGGWQKFWETDVVPKMESDDVDAAATAKDENEKKMLEMINAAGVKAFNKEEHGEVFDYFSDLLDAGKAMRHKAELEALEAAHKSKSKKEDELIAEIEKLGEKDVPLAWLWEDEKDPTFDQDEEYEKEGEAYEHEHEHDVDEEDATATDEPVKGTGTASGSASA